MTPRMGWPFDDVPCVVEGFVDEASRISEGEYAVSVRVTASTQPRYLPNNQEFRGTWIASPIERLVGQEVSCRSVVTPTVAGGRPSQRLTFANLTVTREEADTLFEANQKVWLRLD